MKRPITLLLAAAMTLVVAAPFTAYAQTRGEAEIADELDETFDVEEELSEQLDEVNQLVDSAEEELSIIEAKLEDARARLVAAEGQVALAEEGLREAEEARDLAVAEHLEALAELAETEKELEFQEARLNQQVVHMYKHGVGGAQQGDAILEILRRVDNPNDFAVAMKQLQTITNEQANVVDTVFNLKMLHEEQEAFADEKRRESLAAAAEAQRYLNEVEELRRVAEGIKEQIEEEEENQRELIEQLIEEQGNVDAALLRVNDRKEELLIELSERRSAVTGTGGGPDVAGVCPVQGAIVGQSFINDWGFPRSGGRRHQGNDMFAPEGTPIVAIQNATIIRMDPESRPTNLGGVTVTYRAEDGSEWYNAHLYTIAPGLQVGDTVERGQQIGTVGRTGNARTTPPHNHIQRRWNGVWVNPYPTIALLCRDGRPELSGPQLPSTTPGSRAPAPAEPAPEPETEQEPELSGVDSVTSDETDDDVTRNNENETD